MSQSTLELELKKVEERVRARRMMHARTSAPPPPGPVARLQVVARRCSFAFCVIIALALAAAPLPGLFKVASTTGEGAPGIGAGEGEARPLGSSAGPKQALKDPLEELLDKIQKRRFDTPEEVAAGWFLRDFAAQVHEVDEIDTTKLWPRRRGMEWCVILAPSRTDHEPWEKPKPSRTREIRCVKDGDCWKVERFLVIRGRSA